MKKAIFISGVIGSGKTTLATRIAKMFNLKLRKENIKDEGIIPKIYEYYDSFDPETIVDVQRHFIHDSKGMISNLEDDGVYVFDTFPFKSQEAFLHSLQVSEFIDFDQYHLLHQELEIVTELDDVQSLHIHCSMPDDIYTRIHERGSFEVNSFIGTTPNWKFQQLIIGLETYYFHNLVDEQTVFDMDPYMDKRIEDFLKLCQNGNS